MPRTLILIATLITTISCSSPRDTALTRQYLLTGTIVRVDESRKTVTVKHGPIRSQTGELWMEPMTMEFPVRGQNALSTLKPGLKIKATVKQRQDDYDYWIEHIQVEETLGETSHVLGHPPHAPAIVD